MKFHEKLISIAADKRKIEQAERLKLQEQLKLSVRSEAVVPVVEKKNEMEGVKMDTDPTASPISSSLPSLEQSINGEKPKEAASSQSR